MNKERFHMISAGALAARNREDDPRDKMTFAELRETRWYKELSMGGKNLLEFLWKSHPNLGAWPGAIDGGRTIDFKRDGDVLIEICDLGGKEPFTVNVWLGNDHVDTFHISRNSEYWFDDARHLKHILDLTETGAYFGGGGAETIVAGRGKEGDNG